MSIYEFVCRNRDMHIERRYSVPLWLRRLLRHRVVEAELDEEIRDLVEQQTGTNVAAEMNPTPDARRHSRSAVSSA